MKPAKKNEQKKIKKVQPKTSLKKSFDEFDRDDWMTMAAGWNSNAK